MGEFFPKRGLPVLLRYDNERFPYELAEPVRYTNEITDLVIPRGFELDFASIPRALWWLWPKVGRYARAALVHDALYRKGEVSRVQADALFLAVMEQDGVRWRDRWPIYLAVRLFGWIAWRRLRRAEQDDPQHDWRRPRWKADRRPADISWPLLLVALAAILLAGAWACGQCQNGLCPVPPGGWRPAPAAPAAGGAPLVVPEAVRTAAASIVRIAHAEGNGTASLGSGVVVDHDDQASYILTCAHLFTAPGRTFIRLADRQHPAEVLELDRQNDVTLLRVPGRLPLAAVPYADLEGGEVYAGGFGSDGRLRLVGPRVLGQTAAVGARAPSVVISGQVRQGDSGGPVFNARGEVVGVVWGAASGATYAMHRGPVRAVLDRILSRPRGERPLAPVPRSPPPVHGDTQDVDPGPCRDALALREDLRALGEKVDSLAEKVTGLEASGADLRAGAGFVAAQQYEEHRREVLRQQDQHRQEQTEQRTLLERLHGRVEEVATSAAGAAQTYAFSRLTELAVASLGLGGPIGAGLWIGLRALRAARNRGGDGREAVPQGGFRG